MYQISNIFSSISFGEMELSNLTVSILALLTVSTFLSVAISSLKLFQSSIKSEDRNN